ncbi:phospho-N-acetylmuramoyl-pentapeptide-transferase [Firmicutes bacterium CAG:552]|nr:phospho-N-acetylmuramoyl-pentapeptide-transferase [Firmicutes bacterium CAG:552]
MNTVYSFLAAFAVTVALAPIVIYCSRKFKLRQTVLHYVSEHKSKSGTPTMGGIAFLIGSSLATLLFGRSSLSLLCLVVFIGYGVIGFLDDYIKIKYKRNEGLKPYQKIVFQLLIAIIVSIAAYKRNIKISLIFDEFDFGLFAIPFNVFVFLAFTNSVNLTDGLDGLASTVTLISMTAMGIIVGAFGDGMNNFCLAISGGVAGFLIYNCFPAKIFMGDTGSLALGGAFAAVTVYSGQALCAVMCGAMFVWTAMSVIIQVLHFKRTKRRVFKMAPFHHHLQESGLHENRIVAIYGAITLLFSISAVLFTVGVI